MVIVHVKLSFRFSDILLRLFNIWLSSTWWNVSVLPKEERLCFFCFWSVIALSPVLKMESVVYAGPFCLPHEHLWCTSWAETVTFIFSERSNVWQSHKTNSERGWACSGSVLVHGCEDGRNVLLWACLKAHFARSSWFYFRIRNAVEENEIRVWRTRCYWKEW